MINGQHKLNKFKLILYILSIGLIAYIFLFFTSVIDPSFSLDEDYCKEYSNTYVSGTTNWGEEMYEGGDCIIFRSYLDEQTYNYNQGVSGRKLFWLILTIIITIIASKFLIPIFYPNEEERLKVLGSGDRSQKYAIYIPIVIFSFIGVAILQFIMPKPAEYAPFITYSIEKWEEGMKNKILSGKVYITSEGKVIKR